MKLGLIITLIFLQSGTALANNLLNNKVKVLEEITGIEYLRDQNHQLTIKDFIDGYNKNQDPSWQQLNGSNINFLYDLSTHWFKFPLTNPSDKTTEWVLDIEWPFLDIVNLYILDPTGRIIFSDEIGDLSPNYLARESSRLPKFDFSLYPNNTYTAYLKVYTESSVIVPISIESLSYFNSQEQSIQAAYGLFFGSLLIMAMYNLVLSVFTRDKSYVFYVAYLASVAFYTLAITGIGQQYIWHANAWVNEHSLALSVALSFLFGAFFTDNFLNLKHRNPLAHKLIRIAVATYLTLAIASLFAPEFIIITIEQPVGLLACIVLFLVAYHEWRTGSEVAKYFLIAWIALLFGTCVYTLLLLGIVPRNLFTENIQMLGFGIETLLLSLALANRINQHRLERMATLQALFETSKDKYAAEAEAKARGDFFAKISHEIRTPIGGVMGIAELLKDTELSTHQHRFVDTIYNSGESLLTIVNDILDFSKIDAGKLELENIPFNIRQLAHDCVDIVAVRFKSDATNFKLSIDDSLPKFLLGDPIRVRQILLNLISNAAKFTDNGDITLSIFNRDINSENDNITIEFQVLDNGIGLSEEQISKLFKPFQQADKSTTRRFGGTGLGLAICKELVELMNGEIGVQSELGNGACFWFKLNLPPTSPPEDKITINDESINKFRGMHVLVAEDNPVNQMVLKGLLKKLGITADYAENGVEAINFYKSNPSKYSSILMDCEMPEMDGFDASSEIRKFEAQSSLSNINIIALTAHAFGEFDKKLEHHGMNHYIMKPPSVQLLASALTPPKIEID